LLYNVPLTCKSRFGPFDHHRISVTEEPKPLDGFQIADDSWKYSALFVFIQLMHFVIRAFRAGQMQCPNAIIQCDPKAIDANVIAILDTLIASNEPYGVAIALHKKSIQRKERISDSGKTATL
jgi:ABC-type sulfate transport system permease subunit